MWFRKLVTGDSVDEGSGGRIQSPLETSSLTDQGGAEEWGEED